MLRGRRETTRDSAPVPGQRTEPATPPDGGNDDTRDDIGRVGGPDTGTQAGQAAPATPVPQAGPPTPVDPVNQPVPAASAAAGPGTLTDPGTAAVAGTGTQPRPGAHARGPESLPHHKIHRTRVSGAWVAIFLFAVVLLLLLIFILQNSRGVDISYLGMHGHLSLGVALLLAAVCGILLVAFAGSARIIQLRATARKHRRADANAAPARR
jgi:lipopolysaccharide assembly protein A